MTFEPDNSWSFGNSSNFFLGLSSSASRSRLTVVGVVEEEVVVGGGEGTTSVVDEVEDDMVFFSFLCFLCFLAFQFNMEIQTHKECFDDFIFLRFNQSVKKTVVGRVQLQLPILGRLCLESEPKIRPHHDYSTSNHDSE